MCVWKENVHFNPAEMLVSPFEKWRFVGIIVIKDDHFHSCEVTADVLINWKSVFPMFENNHNAF